MKQLVCVSGPHGGGKTTLIGRLLESPMFKDPRNEIDLLNQFDSFSLLADWERSLVRLYHRIFKSSLTVDLEPDKCVLVSRGPLDSEAYITAYHRLGWISRSEHQLLRSVLDAIPTPVPAILLAPKGEVIRARLDGRTAQNVRRRRDQYFAREDQPEFIDALRDAFMELVDRPNVLLLHDNSDADMQKVLEWVRTV